MNITTNNLDRVEQLALRAFCRVLNDLLEQKPLKSTERWTLEDSGIQVSFFAFTPTGNRSRVLVQLSSPIAQDSMLSQLNWYLRDRHGHVLENGSVSSSGQIQLGILEAEEVYSLCFVASKHMASGWNDCQLAKVVALDWSPFDEVIAADAGSTAPRISIFEQSPTRMRIDIERVRPGSAEFGAIAVAILSRDTGVCIKKWLVPIECDEELCFAYVRIDEFSQEELDNVKWCYTIDSRQLIESTSKQEVLDLIESQRHRLDGDPKSAAQLNRLLSFL